MDKQLKTLLNQAAISCGLKDRTVALNTSGNSTNLLFEMKRKCRERQDFARSFTGSFLEGYSREKELAAI